MRQIHRIDSTQPAIMEALQAIPGAAVRSLSKMGAGWPDLMVAIRSYTCLVECKAPGGELTAAQANFIATWPGDVFVVSTPERAVERVVEGARKVFA